MSWFAKPVNKDAARREARAPHIAKHGEIVLDGTLYKCGREFKFWSFKRYDIHENNTLIYYDVDKYKGELDLREVTITFGADAQTSIAQALGGKATGKEIALDMYIPSDDSEKSKGKKKSAFGGRNFRMILESPQQAALFCSTIAALDPDALSNAQDFAASAGWMMPRRASMAIHRITHDSGEDSDKSENNHDNAPIPDAMDAPNMSSMELVTTSEPQQTSPDDMRNSVRRSTLHPHTLTDATTTIPDESVSAAGIQTTPQAKSAMSKLFDSVDEPEEVHLSPPPPIPSPSLIPCTPGPPIPSPSLIPHTPAVPPIPSPSSIPHTPGSSLSSLFPVMESDSETPLETFNEVSAGDQVLPIEPIPIPLSEPQIAMKDSEYNLSQAPEIIAPSELRSPRTSLMQWSSAYIRRMSSTLLASNSTPNACNRSVYSSGVLYVLAESPEMTTRDALISASPSNHDAADKLEWQPRLYEIDNSNTLRIQCGGKESSEYVECVTSSLRISLQSEGCARLAVKHSQRLQEFWDCSPRFLGADGMFQLNFRTSPLESQVVSSTEVPATMLVEEPVAKDGLRRRRMTSGDTTESRTIETNRIDADISHNSSNMSALAAVPAAHLIRRHIPSLAPLSSQTTLPMSDKEPGADSLSALEDAYNDKGKLFKSPVLKIELPGTHEFFITFAPSNISCLDVLLDDRLPLSYGTYAQSHLSALQQAHEFISALQKQGDITKSSSSTDFDALLRSIEQQQEALKLEHRRLTIVFNGSATDSAGHISVFVWCLVMMYTILRPTAMRLFLFTVGTALFIACERWLRTENGRKFFKEIQLQMQALRIAKGDHKK